MMLDCEFVLENAEKAEDLGIEMLITVPGSIDLSEVRHYRQSVDNDGNPEDFTIIYTVSNLTFCIDMTIGEFKYNYKKYKENVDKIV